MSEPTLGTVTVTASRISGPSGEGGMIGPQDYTLKTITLLTPSQGAVDITPIFFEVSYFEDIFSNSITGRIVVGDANGYVEKFSLTGNEYLRLTFSKGSKSKNFDVDKLFRVYKMSLRSPIGNMSTEGYTLHFCSDELLLSEQYRISKSYKNSKISEIIKDICDNHLKIPKTKISTFEETPGIYDFIIPNLKAFEAINWLSNYARTSSDGVGADMLFFENKDGYNFQSLQTLFQKDVYRSYVYEPKNVDTKTIPTERKYHSVLTYQFMNSYDTLDGINNGVFANRLITVDPLLRKHSVVDFNYKKYQEESKKLNDMPIVNDTQNRNEDTVYETPESMIKLVVTNKGQKDSPYLKKKPGSYSKDIFIENFVPNRTAQLALANYNKIKLVVDGDPGATVGSTIFFTLLQTGDDRAEKEPDKFFTGKYLITAVKHSIDISKYVTTLEIVKESNENEYANPDNKSTLWQNTVKGIIKNEK